MVQDLSKRKTQKIERKHLRLRARIKRLARRTTCFSKSEEMHDKRDWAVYQSLRVGTINLEINNITPILLQADSSSSCVVSCYGVGCIYSSANLST